MTRIRFAESRFIPCILWTMTGCRPGVYPDSDAGCDKSALTAGEVRAYRMSCSDVAPGQGEGRKGDWLLENEHVSAVVRKPEVSLGFIGLGGGTLIDLAQQGGEDLLWEAIPVLDGGWMQPLTMDGGVDSEGGWVRVSGYAMTMEGEALSRDVEFTWRLKPGSVEIGLSHADALVMQGRVGVSLEGGWWMGESSVLGVGSDGFEDWGGAVAYEGSVRVGVGSADRVGEALWPGGARASGVCGGDGVRVMQGNKHVATLRGEFDTRVPSAETLLICEAKSHADGLPQQAGENLELETGPWGAVRVRVADDAGVDVPVLVRWEEGVEALGPGGGLVHTGPGHWSLLLDRGPRFDVVEAVFDVVGEMAWDVVLKRRISETGWVLAELGRQTHPSRFNRISPADDLDHAAAAGRGFVMQAAVDEIVIPSMGSFSTGWLRNRAGVLSETTEAGRVWSWPWEGSEKHAGHGAPDWHGVTAIDLAALSQGAGLARRVLVDSAWMAAAGPPHTWDPIPDALFVSGSGDVHALVDALERGAWMGVVGPLTWLPAETTSLPSIAACERSIVLGETVATNGMLLKLEVVDGQWAPSTRAATNLRLSVQGRSDLQVDAVSLWSGGAEVSRWEPPGGILAGWTAQASAWSDNWVLAVAEGADWAITSPLWLPAEVSLDQP